MPRNSKKLLLNKFTVSAICISILAVVTILLLENIEQQSEFDESNHENEADKTTRSTAAIFYNDLIPSIATGFIYTLSFFGTAAKNTINTILTSGNHQSVEFFEVERNKGELVTCLHSETKVTYERNIKEISEVDIFIDNIKNFVVPLASEKFNQEDLYSDRAHVIEALFYIADMELIGRCQIQELLQYKDFKIIISPYDYMQNSAKNVKEPHGILFYYSKISNAIHIADGVRKINLRVLVQILSHEIKHAVDSLHNRKNQICLFDRNGKTIAEPSNYCVSKRFKQRNGGFLPSKNDKKSFYYVQDLINKDINKINDVIQILSKKIQLRSKAENKILDTLKKLISDEQYTHHYSHINLPDNEVSEFIQAAQKHNFRYNSVLSCYKKTTAMLLYKTELYNYYIDEIVNGIKPLVIASLTNPSDCSIDTLLLDLLLNLKTVAIHASKVYENDAILYEIAAMFDEILNPYPRLQWELLPNLSQHRIDCASDEFKTCLISNRL